MNETHIFGTCGNCGGPVSVPRYWLGVRPPIPRCESCGATPDHPYGPLIKMASPAFPVKMADRDEPTQWSR